MAQSAQQPTALDSFMSAKSRIDSYLSTIQAASEEHFGVNPDDLDWTHAGSLQHLAFNLGELVEEFQRHFPAPRPANFPKPTALHVFRPDFALYCETCGEDELTGNHGMISLPGISVPQYANADVATMYAAENVTSLYPAPLVNAVHPDQRKV